MTLTFDLASTNSIRLYLMHSKRLLWEKTVHIASTTNAKSDFSRFWCITGIPVVWVGVCCLLHPAYPWQMKGLYITIVSHYLLQKIQISFRHYRCCNNTLHNALEPEHTSYVPSLSTFRGKKIQQPVKKMIYLYVNGGSSVGGAAKTYVFVLFPAHSNYKICPHSYHTF